MERVGEHPVPVGPLAVRWLAYALDPPRAGAELHARVRLLNAGSATWRSRGDAGIRLSYHWLDDRGNPIVWDGMRTPLPAPVAPGQEVELELRVRAPLPPARYRLAFDLVEEHRFWLSEVGNTALDVPVEVEPRIGRALAAVVHPGPGDAEATRDALAAQREPLVDHGAEATVHLTAGCLPPPDWSARLLDAHQEGYAAVGSAVEVEGDRRTAAELAPWRPTGGRNPSFRQPLLFPSLVRGLEPTLEDGRPVWTPTPPEPPDPKEPWLWDGSLAVRLRPRPGRPRA